MNINSYAEALAYFLSHTRFNPTDNSSWSLERMKTFLARLGNPHQNFPSLLIAGTKGKGSTAAICHSILSQAGYKTGLFTSPHLHSFRERICLGQEIISEAEVVRLANQLRPYAESTPGLTAFELITAVALVAFAEAKIEFAVLEVGLGGRLDSTNTVDPAVSIITSISYDHMQILGHTLSSIAREKAGIIRPYGQVVCAPQKEEALQVIRQVCQEQQAQLTMIDQAWEWKITKRRLNGQQFECHQQRYHLPLIGDHQVVNAVTAIAAVQDFVPRPEPIQAGIAQVRWPGRLEILHHQPYLVLDSAMNGDSVEKLIQTLKIYFGRQRPQRKFIFIFGASSDHPIQDMLTLLLPFASQILAVAAKHHRAESAQKLAHLVKPKMDYSLKPISSVAEALETALERSDPEDVICITGSLFLVAEARELWMRERGLPLPPLDPNLSF